MLILNQGKQTEVAVRVYLESEPFGREFFDSYGSMRECLAAVARLARSALKEAQNDGVPRQVGIVIVPALECDSEDGYDFGLDGDAE